MNSTAVAIICLAAFALSIFISYHRKLNTGVLAMAFAYLIGCFILNNSDYLEKACKYGQITG